MSAQELLGGVQEKSFLYRLTAHLNLNEDSSITYISRNELLSSAWKLTGKHLRESLEVYGESTKREANDSRR